MRNFSEPTYVQPDPTQPLDSRRTRPTGAISPTVLAVTTVVVPVALIGGWLVAGALQPAGYSWVSATISELAATTARDRWVMTAGFVLTGVGLLVFAAGLTAARLAGRIAIGIAGAAVLGLSAQPLPQHALVHSLLAWLSFLALALWPALGAARGSHIARLRPGPSWAATAVGLALIVASAPAGHLGAGGALERLLAAGQILWLCAVVRAAEAVR